MRLNCIDERHVFSFRNVGILEITGRPLRRAHPHMQHDFVDRVLTLRHYLKEKV
jgi:hypothetical protein